MSASRRRLHSLLLFLLIPAVAIALVNQRWVWRPFFPIQFQAELVRESQRNGLDPFLVAAVVRTESGWRSSAVSPRGAIGLMQIMPDTGRWAADQIGIGGYSDESLFDPEINLRIGCWYLAELRREFKGDKIVMLAAYNAGRGNVNDWLKSQRWNGKSEAIGDIPFSETRQFVGRVIDAEERLVWIYGSDYLARKGQNSDAK